jgi:hypothetical protein
MTSSEGLPCKQNEHLFGWQKYSNKIAATESNTSNKDGLL